MFQGMWSVNLTTFFFLPFCQIYQKFLFIYYEILQKKKNLCPEIIFSKTVNIFCCHDDPVVLNGSIQWIT